MLRLHGTNGSPDFTFAGRPNNAVFALARQTDGRIVAGGQFTSANGQSRIRVVRFHPDGTLDLSFDPGPGPDAQVSALAIQSDGKIVIGGLFTNVAGLTRTRVARLNGDGSLDASFDPGLGPNAEVNGIAVLPNGFIFLGGACTNVAGVARARVARLTSNGSVDPEFDPGFGANGVVYALRTQPGGSIYLGGAFTSFNGVSRNRVLKLNGDVIVIEPYLGQSGFEAKVETVTGRTYWLEFATSPDGEPWTPVTSVAGDGSAQTLADPSPGATGFYRVRVE